MSYLTEAIKEKVNGYEVLEDVGARIKRQTGNEILFKCLNPDHHDKHASCYYNMHKHVWNCLGCDWKGDVFSLVMLTRGCSYRRAVRYLKDFTNITLRDHEEETLIKMLEYKTTKFVKQLSISTETHLPTHYSTEWDNANKTIKRYINQRKISVLVRNKYFIGYCNDGFYKDRIILPIIHYDKIVGFCARSTWKNDSDYDDRYLFESDAPVGEMIWGLFNDHRKKNPIFVEGIFDALRLRSYGLNAYTCLNNNITKEQAELIDNSFEDKIYIMPDNDNGGRIMKEAFHKTIAHKKEIHVCSISKPDPDVLTKKEAYESLEQASPLTEIKFNKDVTFVNSIQRRL